MTNLTSDFVAEGNKKFRFQIGRSMASALSGFIAGVAAASIIWWVAVYLTK